MEIRDAIRHVTAGKHLDQAAAAAVMEQIMEGAATPAQIAALLTALALKGEHDSEIAGMAEVMRAKVLPVPVDHAVVDTCGTGGDGSGTFNISTTTALVVAGAGVPVAKHGNRAMSSASGSADLLEALGVAIELDPAGVARSINEARIGFMFAPRFHPAMRHAAPVRREIGIRTVFNVLGPLTNPAGARHQVLGVATPELAATLAAALSRLDTARALVVHGHGGMDELNLSGSALVYDVRGGQPPRHYTLDPAHLGLPAAPNSALQGGDAATNAAITRAILHGEDQGPRRAVVLLNAAAALVAADAASDFGEGLELARHSLDQGHAAQALERMVAVTQASASGY